MVRLSGPIDVHVISHAGHGGRDDEGRAVPLTRRHPAALPPRRRLLAWAIAAAGLLALSSTLVHMRDDVSLPSILLLYLLLVVVVATVGGLAPAVATAVVGFLVVNWLFTPPINTWTIARARTCWRWSCSWRWRWWSASWWRRPPAAVRRGDPGPAEAETLAGLAGTVAEADPLPVLIDHLRRAFGLEGAALLRRDGSAPGPATWSVEAASGSSPPATPEAADRSRSLGDGLVLALRGAAWPPRTCGCSTRSPPSSAAAIDRRRGRRPGARAQSLAEADELRTALLQAVSHDLRTPLAGIKASASSLRQPDIDWSDEDRDEFLRTSRTRPTASPPWWSTCST